MKKQNKGITLVALVITIIILLILAGISISALTGSGLFQKAGDAKNSYEEAERRENSILGEYENYIDNLGNGGSTGSLPSNAETTPYLPDSSSKIIENSNLETGLVVADKNNNEWVWIVVPKSVTASATTDLEIEEALQDYARVYRKGSASQNCNWKDEWYDYQSWLVLCNGSASKNVELRIGRAYGKAIGSYCVKPIHDLSAADPFSEMMHLAMFEFGRCNL